MSRHRKNRHSKHKNEFIPKVLDKVAQLRLDQIREGRRMMMLENKIARIEKL